MDSKAIEPCGITATPPHKDIHKTALGATRGNDDACPRSMGKAQRNE